MIINFGLRRKIWKYIPVFCWSLLVFACSSPGPGSRERQPETRKPEETRAAVMPTKGIDVSHFSKAVDWQAVKAAGYNFAFAKASEGVDLKDSRFDVNWQAMKEAGLIRGAYHFYVTEDDPRAQAEFFIKIVTLEPGDFAPAVDIEALGKNTKPGLAQRFQTFLDIIEKHYGITPIIYTGLKFWDSHLTSRFGKYPLWIAEYGVDEPVDPKGWQEWHFWQWKEDAQVPGVQKSADLNIFNTGEKDVSLLLIK